MSKITLGTSRPLPNVFYISWVINRVWLINESPSLNPDLWDIKSFSVKHTRYHTIFFQIFLQHWKANMSGGNFQYLLISFFMCRNYIYFFYSRRKRGITKFHHPNTYHIIAMGDCKERHHKISLSKPLSYYSHGLCLGQGFW